MGEVRRCLWARSSLTRIVAELEDCANVETRELAEYKTRTHDATTG